MSCALPSSSRKILQNLEFRVLEGEFVLVCGPNGSGKSTLAKLLAGILEETGSLVWSGSALYRGKEIWSLDQRLLCSRIGSVWQNPHAQSFCSTVELELAFGLENLGLPAEVIRRRVAEVAFYFGLEHLLERNPRELSGGELQRVMLAAAVATANDVLVLDEPLSRLDPSAAEFFPLLLQKVQQELGITLVLFENRIDPCLVLATRAILLQEGRFVVDEPPEKFVRNPIVEQLGFLPRVAKWFRAQSLPERPLSVAEGAAILRQKKLPEVESAKEESFLRPKEAPAIELRNVIFSRKNDTFILKIDDFQLFFGEIVAVLGSNGAGKTTLLELAMGIHEGKAGKIRRKFWNREAGLEGYFWIPQEASEALWRASVREELAAAAQKITADGSAWQQVAAHYRLESLLETHPRRLSGGEKARLLLACASLSYPAVLFADEPTRELDPLWHAHAMHTLRAMAASGTAILLVTEDIELAASVAHRIALLQGGKLIAISKSQQFLEQGIFFKDITKKLTQTIKSIKP